MATLLLLLFASWKSSTIDAVLRVLLIIELKTDLVELIHDENLLMELISDSNLSVEHIQDAHVTRLPMKLTIRPVFVSFQKCVIPSGDNSRSKY